MWYKQAIEKFSLTLGLQDLNANFANSECGGLFTNSSFRIQSSISGNTPTPIFPLTALGVNLKYIVSKTCALQLAVFDGMPNDLKTNSFNIHLNLGKNKVIWL